MKSIAVVAVLALFTISSVTRGADTALETQMKKMAEGAHQLDADLKLTDPTKHNKDLDLKSVAAIKAGAVAAQSEEPKKAKTLPADQEKAMTDAYQKDMIAFAQDVDQLGTDIQAEKWDIAQTDFKKVMDDEHNGHKAYRVKK